MTKRFDVAVVGGGVAGSTFAGVLARAGLGVIVIEKELVFRDRVRGEGIHPWGVAEASRLGIRPVLAEAGANELPIWQSYDDRAPNEPYAWADDSIDGLPELGVSHPRLQEASIAWAATQGAEIRRPAKVVSIRLDSGVEVDLRAGDVTETIHASWIVGADGKESTVRRWIGARTEQDAVHHRFGGGLFADLNLDERATHEASFPGGRVVVLPQGGRRGRAYLVLSPRRLAERSTAASRDWFGTACAEHFPLEAFATAQLAGPVAFFPNADLWSSHLVAPNVALIGDAAGANDPSVGHGLSLAYRDGRELSDLVLGGGPLTSALAEYACRREHYAAVLREHAKWIGMLTTEEGPDADRRRERVKLAREQDPSAAGFALIYARGPDGLVADETNRRLFFGEG